MSAGRAGRQVRGFVVKIEEKETDLSTGIISRKRREVSRVYHSRDAADVCCEMFKKHNPQGDYFVVEKSIRNDNAEIY